MRRKVRRLRRRMTEAEKGERRHWMATLVTAEEAAAETSTTTDGMRGRERGRERNGGELPFVTYDNG